jgi:transcriptional regulator of acetoin/glycerol metabolism
MRKPIQGLTPGAERVLLGARWEGNVRELKNVIERAALLADGGTIAPELLRLPPDARAPIAARNLDEPSRDAVVAALAQAEGVVSRAAHLLGLSRQALYRRIERYGLARPP